MQILSSKNRFNSENVNVAKNSSLKVDKSPTKPARPPLRESNPNSVYKKEQEAADLKREQEEENKLKE